MRLSFEVPDDTNPDVLRRLVQLSDHLSRRPELVDEISLDDEIESMFTPERLAQIDEAYSAAKMGTAEPLSTVREHLMGRIDTWTP